MFRRLTAAAVGTALLAAGLTAGASASPAAVTAGRVAGLPDGVPAAALRPEPALPVAKGWPFAEAFPRTSGTERLGGGASYWSDFLYDDHGANALGLPVPVGTVASLAPTDGTYTYPAGPAAMNGADVFRNAVGLDADASYWRVDWNTLKDPAVPVAVWGLDTNAFTQDGVRAWPAGAGVSSPGLDRALVVSSRGAWLVDARTGARRDVSAGLTVDRAARSFVVRVPRTVLRPSGTWRVRLVAGLANAAGDGMAPVAGGAAPGGTAVYNASYRSVRQEPQQYRQGTTSGELGAGALPRQLDLGNYWMEDHQADALSRKDVAPFGLDLRWSDLAARKATPEPLVTGYSNRWLVSRVDLGQGVVEDAMPPGDLRPNFLGRVQPYAVYVPTTYRPGDATPLTWLLHSLGVNHNQYGALDPVQVQQTCEDRRSICATTLGRGPDMWYFDEAEADFWEVWNRLAKTYTLDPERTVVGGYSMGGYAAYKLGLSYPDLFAKAYALAGPPTCGVQVVTGVRRPAADGRCTTDGDTTPLVGNARELQYVIASGVVDELVPFTSVLQQVDAFDRRGYRYHAEYYPAEGHLAYAAKDAFSLPTSQLGRTVRAKAPARIDHTWYPHLSRADLGIGTTGVYWARDLVARSTTPGTLARVTAHSRALPDAVVSVHKAQRIDVPGDPSPATVIDQTWQRRGFAPTGPALSLGLTGVRSLRVDAARAGLASAARVALDVTTDGRSAVRLTGLRPGAVVAVKGAGTRTADRSGTVQVAVGG